MTRRRSLSVALATALLLCGSVLHPMAAEARGGGGGGGGRGFGGGGGGFGGGGYHWSGGGDRSFGGGGAGGGAWRQGYQGHSPMYGPNTRSSWGSGNVDGNRVNDSFNNDRFNNDTFNRQVNVNNNFYNRGYNGWNSNWRDGGYWGNRPWNAGWYGGWGGWGWWGANAAAWGIAGLATGAVIGGLVNAAANQQSPVIVVPNTSYQLNYGSVEAVGSYGASFFYTVNGTQLLGAANCQQGLLNGQIPTDADQAQLLNAVCQVAYGAGS
ncbi:hypothetical protein [Cyanobium sp. FACHB-13342]|uniref:hypothetical protein n=1 Tax=Cyanobium sp. FACHB-13342 TaxID=2692793 RepID=UPI001680D4E6|nr:hypothetical protein [Cyanobium sp. FACHB-13342]MBD2423358.1 hypothetical protein [Cyanobium sp. FACHB-13342]